MPNVELPVSRIEQQPGLCGAATAQMILNSRGMIGDKLAAQEMLFAEIQANTIGPRPPVPPNQIRLHECPQWVTQECSRCQGEVEFTCWCSFPPALEKTMQNRGLAVLLSSHANDDAATISVLSSVDFNMPAAALVKGGLHWMVINGYNPDASDHSQVVGGRTISDIFVRNPSVGAANHAIAIADWLFDELLPVTICGAFRNMLPTIGATAPVPLAGPAPPGPKRRPVSKHRPRIRKPPRPGPNPRARKRARKRA